MKAGTKSYRRRLNESFSLQLLAFSLFVAVAAPADDLMHPILTISGSGSGASSVTNISESYYTNSFIPHTPPRNSAQGFAPAVVPGDSGWSWSASAPNQITSTPSGTVLPNAAYPVQTQAVTVFLTTATNNLTRTVNAVYYNKTGSMTSKSMVFNLIDYNKLNQLRSDLDKLAPAYINSGSTPTTRNDNYSRRIAIALLDWARWHPSYYLTAINSPTYINVTPNYLATTGGFGPQRASDHNGLAHEWQTDELLAFDAIYNSVGLTNLNGEMGYDVRQYICDNLFYDEGDFLINHIPISIAIQSNLSGPYAVLPQVARVLGRYDYILWLDAYLDATVRQKIRRDGALEEGEGYSIGYLNANQDAAQNTHDFFLSRPATNATFLAISNRATIFNNTFTYGQGQWSTVSLPSGQLPAFGDTPYNTYFSSHSAASSALLPAYGTLAIGAGSGSQAVQVNQNFSGDNNHMRADMCAFVLWAFNNPYLDNIRYYNGAIGRNFGEQMLAYNTITIDRVNLTPYPDADTYGNGDLTLYEPGNNGIALTEIDGQRAYASKASRFQRLLLLNAVDLAKPYLVDFFRVTGGTNHDYTFHGAMLWNQNWQTSFPLVTNTSLYPMLEAGDAAWDLSTDTPYYGFWRNVSSNVAPQNFQIIYADTNRSTGRDVKLWMTGDPQQPASNYQLYLGTTPVPARDNTVPTNFFNALGLKRPSAIIRHRINSGTLQDCFVSVIEPFNAGVSNIVSVERLPMSGAVNESVGLKITFKDGRVDTCLVNLRNPQIAGANTGSATISTADGAFVLSGRVGLSVDRTNADSRIWTMNATDFRCPGRELSTPTNTYFSGWIAGETRKLNGASNDAFTTTSPLLTGTALRNKWLSFTHGALSGSGTTGISEMFKIDQVTASNGLYSICFTNDHMLEITNSVTSVEQVAPLRTFTTSNSFELALSATAQQISFIPDQTIPPGGASGALNFNSGNLGATAGAALQVSATSSNQTLIPNANLVVGGTGTNRTITVTPAAGQTGTSLITIAVTDGVWTNSRSFNVVVQTFGITASPLSRSILVGNSANFSVTVSATNGFSDAVGLGVVGLPANLGASFNPPTIIGAGSSVLTLTASNAISPGAYPISITATSGSLSSTGAVTLVVTNFVAAPGTLIWTGTNNWSTPLNWTNITSGGNGPPGAANGVVFTNFATVAASNLINNIVDSDTTVASLAFNHTNGFHTTQIAPGRTLTVSGSGGLIVGTETDNGSAQSVYATITGVGGTLNVTNPAAVMVVRQSSANSGSTLRATLDLSSLDIFQANIKQLQLGSFGSNPRPSGKLYLARTNVIVASGAAPAIVVGGQSGGSGNAGNGSFLYLGQASEIFANGISVATVKQGNCSLLFNPAFANASAVFRGANGVSRVPTWAIGDSQSQGGTVNSTGTNDFTGGTVDALVDTMTLGRSSSGSSGNGNPVGALIFDGGSIDVNTLQIGYQSSGGPLGNIATGIFNVNGTAQLTVNSSIELAHIPTGGTNATKGTLTIAGGVVTTPSLFGGGGTAILNFNSGTLDLQGGVITNLTALNVGDGLSSSAELRTAAIIHSTNFISVAANGVLAGNSLVLTPGLLLNGSLSPGDTTVGSITNSGSVTFGAGGRYVFDMADAVGEPGTNWDFFSIGDGLNIQSASTNPFVIELRSLDQNLNDGNPGASDFGNQSSQSWIIATASAGITNFGTDRFLVDTSGFANDLAGGSFSVSTNGNSLLLVFNPAPTPPLIHNVVFADGNFVVSGDGGATGGNYVVLTSTNLANPLGQWQRIQTNTFGDGGSFIFTNGVGQTSPLLFYVLKLQ